MTAKEFLMQAYHLDQRINSKIEQVASLNELARKATSTITGMPKNPNRAVSSMANTVEKIIDLETEINSEIDRLVDLKVEITNLIKKVEDRDYQMLLEKKYLCFKTWEDISYELGWSLRWTHVLHGKALNELDEKFLIVHSNSLLFPCGYVIMILWKIYRMRQARLEKIQPGFFYGKKRGGAYAEEAEASVRISWMPEPDGEAVL